MKKIYCKPSTVVKEIAVEKLIADSLGLSSASGDMLDDSNDILVKDDRGGVWDDEW